MFPISKPELSFAEISEYWAPELGWSRDMVQTLLESAWWLGEISSDAGTTRLELLKRLFKWMRNCEFSAIVFVTPGSASPPETIELPERHLAIDPRPRVIVPSHDVDTWSEASCVHAFQILAEKPSLEYYPEWSPGFHAMRLNSDGFFRLIAVRGLRYPTFWKRMKRETSSAELNPASERLISDEIHRVYDLAQKNKKPPPNIRKLPRLVQDRLRDSGHKASARQIQEIGGLSEFKERRRRPGKTLSSEKRGPRK
jgi:hypothetical protein